MANEEKSKELDTLSPEERRASRNVFTAFTSLKGCHMEKSKD